MSFADLVAKEAVRAHANDLPMEVRGSGEHIRSFFHHTFPFPMFLLTEQAHCRIPWSIIPVKHPSPVRYNR